MIFIYYQSSLSLFEWNWRIFAIHKETWQCLIIDQASIQVKKNKWVFPIKIFQNYNIRRQNKRVLSFIQEKFHIKILLESDWLIFCCTTFYWLQSACCYIFSQAFFKFKNCVQKNALHETVCFLV
jgi:hypothetical protein